MEFEARYESIGMATAWFAFHGKRVLCDKLIRARRFKTKESAEAAIKKSSISDYY